MDAAGAAAVATTVHADRHPQVACSPRWTLRSPVQFDAFAADDILRSGVLQLRFQHESPIDQFVDFDLGIERAVMADAGSSLMGMEAREGVVPAREASRPAAISSPLLDLGSTAPPARRNITGSKDLTAHEVLAPAEVISRVDPAP